MYPDTKTDENFKVVIMGSFHYGFINCLPFKIGLMVVKVENASAQREETFFDEVKLR